MTYDSTDAEYRAAVAEAESWSGKPAYIPSPAEIEQRAAVEREKAIAARVATAMPGEVRRGKRARSY